MFAYVVRHKAVPPMYLQSLRLFISQKNLHAYENPKPKDCRPVSPSHVHLFHRRLPHHRQRTMTRTAQTANDCGKWERLL